VTWKRSSKCGTGTCVEVDLDWSDGVRLRDSKRPEHQYFWFTPDEWRAFVEGVKAGEFDV
jgi:hypothetical protein